jgi:hypothetical protein
MSHSRHILRAAALLLAAPFVVLAQQPAPAPAIDVSGIIFGNFAYRTDSASRAMLGGKSPNQFTIERAYLTFRMPAGGNGAVRVTTDVFQNTGPAQTSYYQGWAVRIKYAYLQYTGMRGALGSGSSLLGRVGILHTVVIDHEESYWPRYLAQTAVERAAFFSSADAGAAGLLTLGNKWGELYGTITNGPGYTSYERDRFKDLALRLSITPFEDHASPRTPPAGSAKPSSAPAPLGSIARTFTISPWVYKGWVGSKFVGADSGANGPVTDGMSRDRYGVFVGVRERRLTAGAEWSERTDGSESGSNSSASPRATTDSTGRLLDAFVVARPLELFGAAHSSDLALIGRFDHFTPNTSPAEAPYAGTTPSYNFWVFGASYDVTQRMTFALDWQMQTGTGFPAPAGATVRPAPDASTIFLHFQAVF